MYSIKRATTMVGRMIIGRKMYMNTRERVSLTSRLWNSRNSRISRAYMVSPRYYGTRAETFKEDRTIPLLHEIQEAIGSGGEGAPQLQFPRVVVIGNQSAGKSSVLEGIVGLEILPKGENMVTRRPLELTLLRKKGEAYGQFGPYGDRIYDMSVIRDRIAEENDGEITSEPLQLTICGPHVYNLTVVDLPGYITVTKAGQSENLPELIEEMCEPYVRDSKNIKLVVMSATNDRANSMGIRAVKRAGEFANTIGVISKIDMIKDSNRLLRILKDTEYLPGLGLIGVKMRSSIDMVAGMSLDEMVKEEQTWLASNEALSTSAGGLNLGMPLLRHTLSQEQVARISDDIPELLSQLEKIMEKTAKNQSLLETIATQPNLDGISRELEKLVNELHPSSPSRMQFEQSIHESISNVIGQTLTDVAQKVSFTDSSVRVEARLGAHRLGPNNSRYMYHMRKGLSSLSGDLFSPSSIEGSVETCNTSKFRDFTMYGNNTPMNFTEKHLEKIRTDMAHIAGAGMTLLWTIPDDYMTRRSQWNRRLGAALEDLVHTHDVPEKTRQICIDRIISFVNETAEKTESESAEHRAQDLRLARLFFNYLVEKISERTDKENIIDSIRHMMLSEKRAYSDYYDIVGKVMDNGWARKLHAISDASTPALPLFLGSDKFPATVDIYGETWNRAYLDLLISRTSDRTFCLLMDVVVDNLIFNTINYSLKFFQNKNVGKETQRNVDKIQKLQGLSTEMKTLFEIKPKSDTKTPSDTKTQSDTKPK